MASKLAVLMGKGAFGLSDELRQFVGFILPVICVWQRFLPLGDTFPSRQAGQLEVEFDHVCLISG